MNKFKFTILLILTVFMILPFKVSAMEIYIKKPTAEDIILEVESSDTIEAVKEKIYNADNAFLPENQKLIFGSKEMEDGRTLADYEVQKGNTIHLSLVVDEENYKVIFDANEGTFKNSKVLTIEKWENGLETSLEEPTRDGYNFLGYFTEKTGGTKFELILAESGIDKDYTFYAHWEENSEVIPTVPEEENPKTFDNIGNSIIMIIISFIGLIGITAVLLKTKKERA